MKKRWKPKWKTKEGGRDLDSFDRDGGGQNELKRSEGLVGLGPQDIKGERPYLFVILFSGWVGFFFRPRICWGWGGGETEPMFQE
jgi:hypothetical protein